MSLGTATSLAALVADDGFLFFVDRLPGFAGLAADGRTLFARDLDVARRATFAADVGGNVGSGLLIRTHRGYDSRSSSSSSDSSMSSNSSSSSRAPVISSWLERRCCSSFGYFGSSSSAIVYLLAVES